MGKSGPRGFALLPDLSGRTDCVTRGKTREADPPPPPFIERLLVTLELPLTLSQRRRRLSRSTCTGEGLPRRGEGAVIAASPPPIAMLKPECEDLLHGRVTGRPAAS
jgi:hypothetical protein